jgi:hypothetical protein
LLACAQQGRAPKEIEIAQSVFDRSQAEVAADSSVRVYIHRLRRKLDEYYAAAPQSPRLVLPKGSYRLALDTDPTEAEEPALEPPPRPRSKPRWTWGLAGLGALLAAVALGWGLGAALHPADPAAPLRASAPWAALLASDTPRTLVLGDYYIFGERGQDGSIERMRREFTVNSAHDLDELKAMGGDRAGRYTDLGLSYLPVGLGDALLSVAPVLTTPTRASGFGVVPASTLAGQTLQANTILYLGYISGLGPLRSPVFDGARFQVGSSYDELVDTKTGQRFMASSHLEASQSTGEDYALISLFHGPAGNPILAIAGTRDAALMAAAAFVTRPASLAQLGRQLDKAGASKGAFEALLGVSALRNVGLDARLITVAKRREPSWAQAASTPFPDEIAAPPE